MRVTVCVCEQSERKMEYAERKDGVFGGRKTAENKL